MNIVIPIEQFNINNVFYQKAIKNTVMTDSNFIRIIYSDDICTYNGISLEFNLPITHIDKSFNKFKCYFDKQESEIVNYICNLENEIINNCNCNKQPMLRISEQFKNGAFKVLNMNNTNNTNNTNMNNNSNYKKFIIKISGLWTNDADYGLTYKFLECGNNII